MSYLIGVGKSEITFSGTGHQLQGMSDPTQKSTGVDSSSPLYSRAFVIQDPTNNKVVAIVVADLWSGTKLLKDKVIEKLKTDNLSDYGDENLLIAGTHTHSAPGGYTGYGLFDAPGGADNLVLETYADSVAASIKVAHNSKALGKIYVNNGDINSEVGKQRSAPAYENNPEDERNRYPSDTDKEMLLLKFVHLSGGGETEIGTLNWYAIHPTDLGQTNTLISGDNKGYASKEFEQEMQRDRKVPNFVAAFANSNCGDVSGNVGTKIADANGKPIGTDDVANMTKHGDAQFKTALDLYDNATEEVSGVLEYWYTRIDMSNVTIKGTKNQTWRYALGMSFAAGSTEDSIPRYELPKGTINTVEDVKEGLTEPLTGVYVGSAVKLAAGLFLQFAGKTGISSQEEKDGHKPKPIVLTPLEEEHLVPFYLPIQLFSIGSFAIAGVPGELTTMAGRRLRESIENTLTNLHRKVKYVALGTYANDYTQYITTKEEYDMQYYEGASTPFGPYTLDAYKQEFENLVANSVGKGDKNIVYISDSLYDVWFYLTYTDTNGTKQTEKTDNKVGQNVYGAFTVPWDAKDITVQAEYKPGLDPKKMTNTVDVSLESQQAKLVTFSSEKLGPPSSIMMKTISCTSYSLYDTKFHLTYVDADGNVTGSSTGVVKGNNFNVPWNGKQIICYTEYKPGFDPYKNSNKVSIDLNSGQIAHVGFKDLETKLYNISRG